MKVRLHITNEDASFPKMKRLRKNFQYLALHLNPRAIHNLKSGNNILYFQAMSIHEPICLQQISGISNSILSY